MKDLDDYLLSDLKETRYRLFDIQLSHSTLNISKLQTSLCTTFLFFFFDVVYRPNRRQGQRSVIRTVRLEQAGSGACLSCITIRDTIATISNEQLTIISSYS